MSDSINKDATFSLKAVINKQKNKVLFAVIDGDFADVLLSFLTLPLGTIVRVLQKHYGDEAPVLGSFTTLYRGLSNLDIAYFRRAGCKEMLLNPSTSFINECLKLKLDIGDSQTTNYFGCSEIECAFGGKPIIGMYNGGARCDCSKPLKRNIDIRDEWEKEYQDVGEVFTQITSTFLLSDDLEILPNETTSVTQILSNLGLSDIDGSESRNFTFGFNEVMDLLKWSLLSSTPLTNIVLKKRMYFAAFRLWIEKFWTESKIGTPADATVPFQVEKIETPLDAALTVKVVFQKSTNKLVFVEAEEDFVEFLFSFLTIPLGKVEYLLGGNTNLKNIDNLYRSITSPINSKYLKKVEIARLINPTVPHGYLSKFRIFHIVEEGPPNLYYKTETSLRSLERYLSPYPWRSSMKISFKSPSAEGYVESPSKYMVKDDLTVTPVCMASYISTITEQKIPLSDVGELVLKIGLQEASSILKASLSSTHALSNALSHLLLKKPKLEH